jgi:FAD synthase
MRDYSQIGFEIIEELLREVNKNTGPCFFPGKFKPPHKGHFEAANYLSNQPNVNMVYVIISNVQKFGITDKDSLKIWTEYLEAQPNDKIKVKISTEGSPIKDIYREINQNPDWSKVYVAAAKQEVETEGYFNDLIQKFPDKVQAIVIPDQFGRISATQMRDALKRGDFKKFSEFLPAAAYNKGITKDVFGMLTKIIK